ncbi:MAG TPA: hypothetical protein PKC30_03080 [Saprospiraceae bacterium]|nr:hypothetical protein [Saprospiraceae bacterium]
MVLTFSFSHPARKVIGYFSNIELLVKSHPVIKKAFPIEENKYVIHETLHFFWFTYSFQYVATIQLYKDTNEVRIDANIKNLTIVTMKFLLEENNQTTLVTETIDIKSSLPFSIALIKKVFKDQHGQWFTNIEKILEE